MVARAFGAAGAALVSLLLTVRLVDGSYTSLVQEWYEPLLVGSVAVLLLLAVVAAAPLVRSKERWRIAVSPYQAIVVALVLTPVVLGIVLQPQPLGSRSLNTNADGTGDAFRGDAVDLLSSLPGDRNVFEWAYAFEYEEPRTIVGEPVDVIAFVHRPDGTAVDRFLAARFAVACCVADATGYTVPVQWQAADELQEDQWVHVIGAVATGPAGELFIQATTVTVIDAPANPYLYP